MAVYIWKQCFCCYAVICSHVRKIRAEFLFMLVDCSSFVYISYVILSTVSDWVVAACRRHVQADNDDAVIITYYIVHAQIFISNHMVSVSLYLEVCSLTLQVVYVSLIVFCHSLLLVWHEGVKNWQSETTIWKFICLFRSPSFFNFLSLPPPNLLWIYSMLFFGIGSMRSVCCFPRLVEGV